MNDMIFGTHPQINPLHSILQLLGILVPYMEYLVMKTLCTLPIYQQPNTGKHISNQMTHTTWNFLSLSMNNMSTDTLSLSPQSKTHWRLLSESIASMCIISNKLKQFFVPSQISIISRHYAIQNTKGNDCNGEHFCCHPKCWRQWKCSLSLHTLSACYWTELSEQVCGQTSQNKLEAAPWLAVTCNPKQTWLMTPWAKTHRAASRHTALQQPSNQSVHVPVLYCIQCYKYTVVVQPVTVASSIFYPWVAVFICVW